MYLISTLDTTSESCGHTCNNIICKHWVGNNHSNHSKWLVNIEHISSSGIKFLNLFYATVEGGGGDMKYDARNFITTNGQQLTLIVRDDGCYLCANDIVSILPQFNRSFLEKKRGMRYVNANRLEIELLKQRGLVAKKACRAALYSAKTIVDICYSSSVQPPSFLADFACEKVQLHVIHAWDVCYIYICVSVSIWACMCVCVY